MDTNIEKIKKIVTDAHKLQVDFEKFVLNGKFSERVNCSLFDKKTLFEIAVLAKKNIGNDFENIRSDNIAITHGISESFKNGLYNTTHPCKIQKKSNMDIYSDGICHSDSKALIVVPKDKKKNNDAIAAANKKKKKPDEASDYVIDTTDYTNPVVRDLNGGGNPTKIGSVYQSFCGLQVFDFDEKFYVFVMDKQQVVKIEFTDSTAYFSLPDTSGTIKFNVNTPYFRIYKDGKKEYGKYLTNDDTLFIDDKNNMKFGEKDLKPEEATQILNILNNNPEPAQSSWSTYALPVAAAATAAAGLAYLYKKSKRKPKKSKSTRRQSSSSSSSSASSSSSSSSRRPVESSRKRKN